MPDPAASALEARLREIMGLAAAGDPAFQSGSAFFRTKTGSAVQSAISGGLDFDAIMAQVIASLQGAFSAQASRDDAAIGLQRELGLGQLALQERGLDINEKQFGLTFGEDKRQFGLAFSEGQRQFDLTFGLSREQFEFQKQDTITQRLFQSAGLATGPTGALQLAFLARGEGAPQEDIRKLFSNLPFVEALRAGEALPGFGLPEQLGGKSQRTSGGGGSGLFGFGDFDLTSVTQQQFEGFSDFEKIFLGALVQADQGIPISQTLDTIQKSFIPTTQARSLAIA